MTVCLVVTYIIVTETLNDFPLDWFLWYDIEQHMWCKKICLDFCFLLLGGSHFNVLGISSFQQALPPFPRFISIAGYSYIDPTPLRGDRTYPRESYLSIWKNYAPAPALSCFIPSFSLLTIFSFFKLMLYGPLIILFLVLFVKICGTGLFYPKLGY